MIMMMQGKLEKYFWQAAEESEQAANIIQLSRQPTNMFAFFLSLDDGVECVSPNKVLTRACCWMEREWVRVGGGFI